MAPQLWDDGEHLLADLAEALASVSASAESVARRAEGALAWRTVDEDLFRASMSFDSAQGPMVLRADEPGSRALVFSAAPLSVELEISARGVLGQIVPPGPGEIHLEASDGVVHRATADDLGFFVFATMPSCPTRLRCETPTGRLVTDWFTGG